jgi:hypothetical protein
VAGEGRGEEVANLGDADLSLAVLVGPAISPPAFDPLDEVAFGIATPAHGLDGMNAPVQ